MNKKFIGAVLAVSLLAIAAFFIFTKPAEEDSRPPELSSLSQQSESPEIVSIPEKDLNVDFQAGKALQLPEMEIDQNKQYFAILKTTKGDVKLELFAGKTPITVNNFVSLARKNFYDDTVFHRVIKDFMIQGGDPKGDGTGGPGYKFDDEPFEGEYTRGTLAMANAGPNTNGSQFFIMHQDYQLPKNYVIFGKVVEGLEVVDRIAESPVSPSPSGELSVPQDPTSISSIEIIEKS